MRSARSAVPAASPERTAGGYELIRAARRTLVISLQPDGCVRIRAPLRMPVTEIERFIHSRQEWIDAKQAEIIRQNQNVKRREGFLLYRGREYPVVLREEAAAPIYFDPAAGIVIHADYASRQQTLLRSWLDFQAEKIITARVRELAAQYRIEVAAIRLADTASQWGSCSATGKLSFSRQLIHCPERVTDYVILHELAHRRELNHSPAFWRLVDRMCPDYRECQGWLHRHAALLRQPDL